MGYLDTQGLATYRSGERAMPGIRARTGTRAASRLRAPPLHDRLLRESQAGPAMVTEVSMTWGCSQPGKFLAQCRRRYGESPAQTPGNSRIVDTP